MLSFGHRYGLGTRLKKFMQLGDLSTGCNFYHLWAQ
jgi:hypothetical protein